MSIDWGFWQVVLAVIAIVVTILISLISAISYYYEKAKIKKNLECIISNSLPLIHNGLSLEKLTILYDGTEIRTPFITNISLSNSGTQPILPNDFIEDIKIKGKGNIYTIFLSSKTPDDLNPEITIENDCISIKKLLLNQKDSFQISLLTNSPYHVDSVSSRIAGITTISTTTTNAREDSIVSRWMTLFILTMSILMFCFLFMFLARFTL